MAFLSSEDFAKVIASTPLVSIDFLVTNSKDQVLLGQRVNKPALGYWFVPGGRILKNETIEQAMARLSTQELGIKLDTGVAMFAGVFEHFYEDNTFN